MAQDDIDLTIEFQGGRSDAGMDLDLDMDIDLDDEQGDERSPTSHAIEGVREGITDYGTDVDNITGLVRHTLPEHMKGSVDSVIKSAGGVRDELRKATNELKPELETISDAAKKILPEGKLRGMVESLEKRLNLNQSSEQQSVDKEQQHSESVASKLDGMFKLEAKRSTAMEVDKKVDVMMGRKIASNQHGESLAALQKIQAAVETDTRYTTEITAKYQRRALELQYKQIFLTRSILEETIKTAKVRNQQFENITKNTALPEYAKLRLAERMGERTRDMMLDFGTKAAFGEGGALGGMMSHLEDFIKTKVQKYKEGIGEFATGVESVGDMVEMGRSMSEFENSYKSGAQMATGFGIDWLLKTGITKMGGDPADKANKLNMMVAKAEAAGHKLPAKLKSMISAMRSSGDGATANTWNSIVGFLEEGMDHRKTYSASVTEALNPDGYGIDKRFYTSVTDIIPGYLGRILQEAQASRLGALPDMITYDRGMDEFTTSKGLTDSIAKTIFENTKEKTDDFNKNVDKALDLGIEQNGVSISDNDKKKVRKIMVLAFAESLNTGKQIDNLDVMLESPIVQKALVDEPSLAGHLAKIFRVTDEISDYEHNDQANAFTGVNINMPNMSQGVVALTKLYGIDQLIKDKIVELVDNEYVLNPKSMVKILGGKYDAKPLSDSERARVAGNMEELQSANIIPEDERPAGGNTAGSGGGGWWNREGGWWNNFSGRDQHASFVNNDRPPEDRHETDEGRSEYRDKHLGLLETINESILNNNNAHTQSTGDVDVEESATVTDGVMDTHDKPVFDVLTLMHSKMDALSVTLLDINKMFEGLGEKLSDAADTFKGMAGVKKITEFIDNISSMSLAEVRASVSSKYASAKDSAAAALERSGIMKYNFSEVIGAGYNTAWRGVQTAAYSATDAASAAADSTTGFFSDMWNRKADTTGGKIGQGLVDGGGKVKDVGSMLFGQTALLAGSMIGGMQRLAESAMDRMPDAWKKVVQGFSWVKDKLFGMVTSFTAVAADVYVTGFDRPVLLKMVMENGGYFDAITLEPVLNIKQIKGEVVDSDSNIVLSTEMMQGGMFDSQGNDISSVVGRLKGRLGIGKLNILDKLKKGGKWIGDRIMSVGSFVSDLWSTITGLSMKSGEHFNQLLDHQAIQTKTQVAILKLLGKANKYNDRDGNGRRDGSWQDQDLSSSGTNVGTWTPTQQSGGDGLTAFVAAAAATAAAAGEVFGYGAAAAAAAAYAYNKRYGSSKEEDEAQYQRQQNGERLTRRERRAARRAATERRRVGGHGYTDGASTAGNSDADSSRSGSSGGGRTENPAGTTREERERYDAEQYRRQQNDEPLTRAEKRAARRGRRARRRRRRARERAERRENGETDAESRSAESGGSSGGSRSTSSSAESSSSTRSSRAGWTTRFRNRNVERGRRGGERFFGNYSRRVDDRNTMMDQGVDRATASRIAREMEYDERIRIGMAAHDAGAEGLFGQDIQALMGEGLSFDEAEEEAKKRRRRRRRREARRQYRNRRRGTMNRAARSVVGGTARGTARGAGRVAGGTARAAAWTGSRVLGAGTRIAGAGLSIAGGAANLAMGGASAMGGATLAFLATPVGMAVAAAVAAGAIYTYRKEIKEGFYKAVDWTDNAITDTAANVSNAADSTSMWGKEILADVSSGIQKYAGVVTDKAGALWDSAGDTINDSVDWVKENTSGFTDGVQSIYDKVVNHGPELMTSMGEWLLDGVASVQSTIKRYDNSDKPWWEVLSTDVVEGITKVDEAVEVYAKTQEEKKAAKEEKRINDIKAGKLEIMSGGGVFDDMMMGFKGEGVVVDGIVSTSEVARNWNQLGVLERFRMRLYGFDGDIKYATYLRRAVGAESELFKRKVIKVEGGKVVFDNDADTRFLGRYFSTVITGNRDDLRTAKNNNITFLMQWLKNRMIPVLMMYVQAMVDSGAGSDISKLSDLKGAKGVNFITALAKIMVAANNHPLHYRITEDTTSPFASLTAGNQGWWDTLLNPETAHGDADMIEGININVYLAKLHSLMEHFVTGDRMNKDEYGLGTFDMTKVDVGANMEFLSKEAKHRIGYGIARDKLAAEQLKRDKSTSFGKMFGDTDGAIAKDRNKTEMEQLQSTLDTTVANAVATGLEQVSRMEGYAPGVPSTDSFDESGMVLSGLAIDTNSMNYLQKEFRYHVAGMAREFFKFRGVPLKVVGGYRDYSTHDKLFKDKIVAESAQDSPFTRGLAISVDADQVVLLDKMGLLSKYGICIPVGGESSTLEPMIIQGDLNKYLHTPALIDGTMYVTYKHAGGGWGARNSPWKPGKPRRNAEYMMRQMRFSQLQVDPSRELTANYDKLTKPTRARGRSNIRKHQDKTKEAMAALASAAAKTARIKGRGSKNKSQNKAVQETLNASLTANQKKLASIDRTNLTPQQIKDLDTLASNDSPVTDGMIQRAINKSVDVTKGGRMIRVSDIKLTGAALNSSIANAAASDRVPIANPKLTRSEVLGNDPLLNKLIQKRGKLLKGLDGSPNAIRTEIEIKELDKEIEQRRSLLKASSPEEDATLAAIARLNAKRGVTSANTARTGEYNTGMPVAHTPAYTLSDAAVTPPVEEASVIPPVLAAVAAAPVVAAVVPQAPTVAPATTTPSNYNVGTPENGGSRTTTALPDGSTHTRTTTNQSFSVGGGRRGSAELNSWLGNTPAAPTPTAGTSAAVVAGTVAANAAVPEEEAVVVTPTTPPPPPPAAIAPPRTPEQVQAMLDKKRIADVRRQVRNASVGGTTTVTTTAEGTSTRIEGNGSDIAPESLNYMEGTPSAGYVEGMHSSVYASPMETDVYKSSGSYVPGQNKPAPEEKATPIKAAKSVARKQEVDKTKAYFRRKFKGKELQERLTMLDNLDKYGAEAGIPKSVMRTVIAQESGLGNDVIGKGTSAYGVGQMTKAAWSDMETKRYMRKWKNHPDLQGTSHIRRKNPRGARHAAYAAGYMEHGRKKLIKSFGKKFVDDLGPISYYLAHLMGVNGATSYLAKYKANPGGLVSTALSASAIKRNVGIFGIKGKRTTMAQVRAGLDRKFAIRRKEFGIEDSYDKPSSEESINAALQAESASGAPGAQGASGATGAVDGLGSLSSAGTAGSPGVPGGTTAVGAIAGRSGVGAAKALAPENSGIVSNSIPPSMESGGEKSLVPVTPTDAGKTPTQANEFTSKAVSTNTVLNAGGNIFSAEGVPNSKIHVTKVDAVERAPADKRITSIDTVLKNSHTTLTDILIAIREIPKQQSDTIPQKDLSNPNEAGLHQAHKTKPVYTRSKQTVINDEIPQPTFSVNHDL